MLPQNAHLTSFSSPSVVSEDPQLGQLKLFVPVIAFLLFRCNSYRQTEDVNIPFLLPLAIIIALLCPLSNKVDNAGE
jgi:hypothetical protein